MFKKIVLILLLPAIAFAQLIDDDVMPFGAYSKGGANIFTDSLLTYMHETLGINQHTGGEFNTDQVGRFYQKEIYPYPWGSFWGPDQFDIKPQKKYAHSTYFVSQPEDSALYNVKFKLRVDSLDDDGVYCLGSSGPRYMLDILKFLQRNRENWLNPDTTVNLEYYPYLQMRVEDCSGGDDAVVGVFEVFWASSLDSCRFYDTLKVGDFTEGRDTLLLLTNEKYLPEDTLNYYTIFDDEASTGGSRMLLRFWTAGNCTVFIDSFLVHCQYGDDLILGLNPQIAEDIVNYVDSVGFQNKVLGWHLKDTQWPGNYRPYAYINRLIRDSTNYNYPVGAVSWLYDGSGNTHSNGYRDFVKITKPQVLWCYLYPIWSGTAYTGFSVINPDSALQSALNRRLVVPCDSIRAVLADSIADSTGWWMYTPQYWYNGPPYPDVIEIRREPTAAELRCETYIGMCYYPKGIMFWLLYGGNAPPDPVGLITTASLTRIGETVRDDINPYIKAIDSTYLGLTWETAYAVDPELAFPSGSSGFIDDITACTNPDSTGSDNPDLGWLQVGEFNDGSNKYFMLVNRACSRDEIGNEAPEITAVVKLNPTTIGSDFVFIIDIAKGTNAANWVGYPETTYTSIMPNTTLPFTTVLKAGEGRLFKILPIDEIELEGAINTNLTYQGNINVVNDVTVPDRATLKIVGPALFEVTSRAFIEVREEGGLNAKGYVCDSVIISIKQEGGVEPPWGGIVLEGGADADLDYVVISDAEKGIHSKDANSVYISHSKFLDNYEAIIALKNSRIFIDNCNISNSNYSGITCTYPESVSIYNSHFVDNNLYAIGVVNAEDFAVFYENIIEGIHSQGIKYLGGTIGRAQPEIKVNTMSDGGVGIWVERDQPDDMPQPQILHNTISNFDLGIVLFDTHEGTLIGPAVCCVNNFWYGIILENGYADIIGDQDAPNLFSYSEIGICGVDNAGQVRLTRFEHNIWGGELVNSYLDFGTEDYRGENSFEGNSEIFLAVYDSPEVSAQLNWWGTTDPDEIEENIIGDVIWEPFLEEPPEYGKVSADVLNLPKKLALNQSYPNPFNITARINFDVPKQTLVSIKIYNILGQEIRELYHQETQPGTYSVIWDGKNNFGNVVSSGVYLYSLKTPEEIQTKKMVLLK